MNSYHSPHHWIWVTVVLMVALLTLSDLYGQTRTDSAAMFQGRPAMAGAQAGTGAMAGPPQGGLGLEGQDRSQVTVRRPAANADMPQGSPVASADTLEQNRAVRNDKDVVKRDRDPGVAKDQRGVVQKTKRAVQRLVKHKKHGVPDVQTAAKQE